MAQKGSIDASGRFSGHNLLATMPVIAVSYVLLALPLQSAIEGGRIINNLFWPVVAVITFGILFNNRSKIEWRFVTSLPVLSLLAYFIFSGASIFWALSPGLALSRYVAHLLAAFIIVAPYALPIRTPNTVLRLQICFAIALAINAMYVGFTNPGALGHAGYMDHKQELGTFAAVAVILSFHGLFMRGWGRLLSILSLAVAVWILVQSESKSAFAFSIFAIGFAGLLLLLCWAAGYVMKITPAYLLGAAAVAASFVRSPVERIGYRLYGDSTLTGRTEIWEYVNSQILQHPWFGWGFHSYYFVPNSPQFTAPGWVRDMPSSHSGYLELELETGRIGYWIFMIFIFASLHGIEQIRRQDPARAWLYLSVAIYAIFVNLLDSYWLVLSQLWLVYLVVTAETVRGALSSSAVPGVAGSRNRAQVRSRQRPGGFTATTAKRPAARLNF